ncbi:MAG: NAD-dependent epimerase/dehydratase family protein [Muribaculaceae bacterium]|nr:NAD-dependent epimerase/dehydratase family protein [Muribaculaceae bacterium]
MTSSYIIVAGGAGFIGSHLCEKLIHSGIYYLGCSEMNCREKDIISSF